MREKLKMLGGVALSLALMLGLVFVGIALLRGTAAAGAWALPFLSRAVGIAAIIGLPILILLSFSRVTRSLAAFGFVLASYLFGVTLWIWSLLFVLYTWGWFAVIVGLVMAGVGVFPIALLAGIVRAEWSIVLQLLLGIALTFGCRFFGFLLASKVEKTDNRAFAFEHQT